MKKKISTKDYEFIMNEFKPKGKLKEIFDVLPDYDSFLDWDDVALLRLQVKKIFDKLK